MHRDRPQPQAVGGAIENAKEALIHDHMSHSLKASGVKGHAVLREFRAIVSGHICQVLGERSDGRAPPVRFEIALEDYLTRHDAKTILRVATQRYAGVFAYDDKTDMLSALTSAT